jgi:protease IV
LRKKYYLELALKEEIVEGRPDYSFVSRKTKTALQDVMEIFDRAAGDRRIAGLLLILTDLELGWAGLSDLRRSITRFRSSGKSIYCFIDSGGNAEYYLASACNQIFMSTATSLQLVGLATEVFFFRELLDRFGVEPQFRAVGEYKSASEMFTRTGMSPPSREQMNALLDDFHEEFCHALCEYRKFSQDEIRQKIDGGPYSAREGMAAGLLDGICYQDELAERLKESLGAPLHAFPARKLLRRDGFFKRLLTFRRPKIAIIDVLGRISSGESRRDNAGRHVAGAETIGKFLDHARKSRRIHAVVLRIDSPGGTGPASDFLWRKISLLRQSKPVVASMGNVAASGGYYVAAAASRILAEPASITGSIGVLAGKLVAKELLGRLAIYRESLSRGAHAELHSIFSPFSEAESERVTRQIEEFYHEDFVKKVASSRSLAAEAVDRVGRGRVWSGKRAREHGLVDALGGMKEAIQEARRLGQIPGTKKVRLLHYQPRRRLRDMFVPEFSPHLHMGRLPQPALEMLELLSEMGKSTTLLWMPFRIRIR